MAIGGEITPEQYEVLFGEPPPLVAVPSAPRPTLAPPLELSEVGPVGRFGSGWRQRRMPRVILFAVLLVALVAAVLLLGVVADSIVNTAAHGR